MKALDQSLRQWLERLYARQSFGIKPGLEMTRTLLAALGNPQSAYRTIHVAGTNGKGSVSAALAAVLSSSGCCTGLYTSPHLIDFNERIRIDGRQISNEQLAVLARDIDSAIVTAEMQLGYCATFFEVTTAMAFEWFRRSGVDWAVIETGMGGRLDSTNVVMPEVSVITSIAFDHQAYLGNSIEQIAAEKAGIIKSSVPVVTGEMPEAAIKVIQKTAVEQASRHYHAPSIVDSNVVDDGNGILPLLNLKYADYRLACRFSLPGLHQIKNLETVFTVLVILAARGLIVWNYENWNTALANVVLPARCQLLAQGPPPQWLDGGHNPEAAAVLAATLQKIYPARPLAIVLGMSSDKDVESFFDQLKPLAGIVYTTAADSERAISAVDLATRIGRYGLSAYPQKLEDALASAEEWAVSNNGVVLVCGSLFLAGDVLRLRQSATRRD